MSCMSLKSIIQNILTDTSTSEKAMSTSDLTNPPHPNTPSDFTETVLINKINV